MEGWRPLSAQESDVATVLKGVSSASLEAWERVEFGAFIDLVYSFLKILQMTTTYINILYIILYKNTMNIEEI